MVQGADDEVKPVPSRRSGEAISRICQIFAECSVPVILIRISSEADFAPVLHRQPSPRILGGLC